MESFDVVLPILASHGRSKDDKTVEISRKNLEARRLVGCAA